MTDRTSGASRFYKSAVATSALPFLALGSTATAAPAVADTPSTDLGPRSATAANVAAVEQRLQSSLMPSDQAAVALPARFTMENFQAARTAPKTYKVKSGDTLGHIALRNNVSLSNLLKWNGLKASSTIYPGDVLDLGPSGSSSSSSSRPASSSSSSSGKNYTVKSGDTLSAIAARHGVSLSTLLRANDLSMSSVIYPGQKLKLSGSASSTNSSSSSSSSSAASSSGSSSTSYTVKSGDTLSAIAARQGVSLSTLLRANGLSMSSIIYPGQTLKLSGGSSSSNSSSSSSSSSSASSSGSSSTSYTVKSGDTLSGIAAQHGVGLSTILRANGLTLSSTIFPGQTIKLSGNASGSTSSSSSASNSSGNSANSSSSSSSYTVKAGDTLSGIAARHGVSLSTLLQANGLSTSSIIFPGQRLKLSGSASASNSGSSSSSNNSSSGPATASTYTVKAGDTLSGIASRNGISLSALLRANGLNSTSIIYPGQTLKLSGSSSVSTASSGDNEQLIGNTFLHYTYPDHVVANANANKRALLNAPMPSRNQVRQMVRDTATSMGVDPRLALAHAQIESAFDPTAVSPANAIGTMQVIPSSGEWASQLVGRKLNLLDPQDNITAGVAIIRHLQSRNPGDIGIAGYYQGEAGVRNNGMYSDTKDYVAKVNAAKNRF